MRFGTKLCVAPTETAGRILWTVERLRMSRDRAVKKSKLGHFAPMLTDAKKPVTPTVKEYFRRAR
jgi:hypothetical protein